MMADGATGSGSSVIGVARCCLVRECDLWSVVVWPAVAWLGSVTSLVCGGVADRLVRECDLSVWPVVGFPHDMFVCRPSL